MTDNERLAAARQLLWDAQHQYDHAQHQAILTDDNDVVATLTYAITHMLIPDRRLQVLVFSNPGTANTVRSLADLIYLRGYEHGRLAGATDHLMTTEHE